MTTLPPLPPGFQLEDRSATIPPPPPGFQLEGAQPAAPAAQPFNDPALFMPGTEPTAPAQQPSWIDQVFGSAQRAGQNWYQFGLGASKGITNVAGLPGDVLSILPKVNVGGAEISPASVLGLGSVPTSQDIQQFFRIDTAPEPQGWVQKLMSRVGEEIGEASVPVGGISAKAVRMGLPAVREAGGLIRYFLEPAATDLPQFLAKEAAGATAAGIGAGVANNLVDRNATVDVGGVKIPVGQLADMAGAFGGVGTVATGRGVTRSLGDLLSALTGNQAFASQIVKRNVVDTLIRNSDVMQRKFNPDNPSAPLDTTDLENLLRSRSNAETTIPGFRASSADRASDFGLANLEDARARGPNAGQFRQRQEANTEAVDTQLNTVAPKGEPGSLFDALNVERDAQLAAKQRDVQDALDAVRRATAPLEVSPNSTLTTRGNTVRSALDAAREAARQRTTEAYTAADTTGNMVDPAQLRRTLDDAMAGMTETERAQLPEGIINRVRNLGIAPDGQTPAPVDLREATTLRTEVQDLWREARAAGRRNAASVLDQVSRALDDFIMQNVSPEQRAALETARGMKFSEAEMFDRPGDPVARALDTRPGGRYSMADERVAGSFLVPDRNLDRLFSAADTPDVRQAIVDEMLSRLDNRSSESIAQFADTYRQQIARFPGLDQQLMAAADAQDASAAAQTAQAELRRILGTPDGQVPGRSAVAKFLKFDETRAEQAMQGVLNAGRPAAAMDELLTFVGDDKQAVEGAKRAFWQVMERVARSRNGALETAKGVEPWLPKRWTSFLEDPKVSAVMDRLYRDDPEHLAMIRQIAQALGGVNMASKAGAALNPSGSAQMLRNGPITVAEAQAKFIDVQRGRLSPLYMVTYLAGKIATRAVSAASEAAYQRLLDRALLDPEAAAALLKENNPANRAALARSAKGWLGAEAVNLIAMLKGDDTAKEEQ